MKKFARIFALVLAVMMAVSVMTGCQEQPTGTTDSGNTVTVTWYQGSSELRTDKVEKGTVLTSWEPTVEGKTFTGWYSEASLSQAFDFSKPINEDTDIFAAFKSDVYVEDTNAYYLIGSGAGSLGASNWDHANSEANLLMTKDAAITDKNVYTITIEMYAGDRFQIAYGGSWDGQQGIGHVPGAAYADGINPNDKTEYTAADKKYAEVKNDKGEVVFIGGDEYDKEFYVWNVILNEGHDGKYKFTLTTYPGSTQYNTIEWELVEKLDAKTETHKMHFIGTHNEWGTDFSGVDTWNLSASEDKSVWTGIITITEDMYEDWTEGDAANPLGVKCAALKLYNSVDGQYYGDNAGQNIFLTAGTYGFKYTVDGNLVEWQELAYYVVGTFVDEATGNTVNFSVKEGVTPKLTVADGVASGEFVAVDVSALNDYSWIASQGKPGVMAVKVVYGCEYIIKDWFSDKANNDDNFYLNVGTYTVSLNIADGTAVLTAK